MSIPPHLELPAGVRARTVSTRRGEFAVLEATPASGAPSATAVLVPGFTGSKEDFGPILEPLTVAGFHVVAIDQRGQCDTIGPADPAAYSLEALGADVLALADILGDGSVHLVGHSFGGLVVRDAAIASPSRVRSLTLLCSGPGAVPAAQADKIAMLVEASSILDLADIWTIAAASAAAAGEHDGVAPDVLAFLARRFTSSSPTGLATMGAQLIANADRTAELAATAVRTLVAHGAEDDVWPLSEQADMAIRLGGHHAVIAGAAHSPAVQNPGHTAALLAGFWAGRG